MKNILLCTLFAISGLAFSYDLSGSWNCHEIDSHDGYLDKETLILKKNIKHSDESHGYVAYDLKILVPGLDSYSGAAVSSGNVLSVWFSGDKDKTDTGVGLAMVEHHLNPDHSFADSFTKFYFEPKYATSGSHGYETCEKPISSSK